MQPLVIFERPKQLTSINKIAQQLQLINQKLANNENKDPANIPYSVCSTVALPKLIEMVNNNCNICKQKLTPNKYFRDGHCVTLELQCCNNHSIKWEGSERYPDGTPVVNRDIVRSWLCVGGEVNRYLEWSETCKIGTVELSKIKKAIPAIATIATTLSRESQECAIVEENEHTLKSFRTVKQKLLDQFQPIYEV